MTAFGMPGGLEIWIILFVALLLFGHRIPSMARSLGSGIVEFKKGLKGDTPEALPDEGKNSASASSAEPAVTDDPAEQGQEAKV